MHISCIIEIITFATLFVQICVATEYSIIDLPHQDLNVRNLSFPDSLWVWTISRLLLTAIYQLITAKYNLLNLLHVWFCLWLWLYRLLRIWNVCKKNTFRWILLQTITVLTDVI